MTDKIFLLDQRIEKSTHFICELPLSRLLLQNDSRFPWVIIVPRKSNIKEIFELEINEQKQLLEEIVMISKIIKNMLKADKINVGALGNIVPQLHVHIIARFHQDAAWPNPVWGFGETIPYTQEKVANIAIEIKTMINESLKL